MKIVNIGYGVLAAGVLLSACKNVEFQKTKSGVAYKIFPGKSKDTIGQGSFIKYSVIQRVTGNGMDTIVQNSFETMPAYAPIQNLTGKYVDAFPEIVSKAHPSDSIYFEQVIDSFIAMRPDIETNTPFRKGQKLITQMRIMQVFKSGEEAQADLKNEYAANADKLEKFDITSFRKTPGVVQQLETDSRLIEDYLKANNIQAQKTPWGAYVQIIDPGTGPKPKVGQYMNVKYTGSNLKGEVFESSVYPLQFGSNGSIKGFGEGLRYLGKGGKSKVFVPSSLGYGERGSAPKIGPNQVLVFDLEMLDLSDNPPTPPMQMPLPDSATKR